MKVKESPSPALLPTIKYVRSTRGGLNRVVEELERRTKRKFHRQQVAAWLHLPGYQPVEPGLKIGLLLAEIGRCVHERTVRIETRRTVQ